MGRELSVDRIDFMKDGSVQIRTCKDYYVCGRTDFTSAIADIFYEHNVTALIVDYPEEKGKVHVITDNSIWAEKEFDLEFASVDKKVIDEVCSEYIQKDNIELEREHAMLNDAYEARRNTSTVKDFQEFSDLIDSLQEHIDSYCEEAKLYNKYVGKLNLCYDERTTEATYILLTLSE